MPLAHLRRLHGWSTSQIHGKAVGGVEHSRAVDRGCISADVSLIVTNSVRQRRDDIGGTSKKVQCMIEAEGRHMDSGGGVGDGQGTVEEDVAIIEGVSQSDRV